MNTRSILIVGFILVMTFIAGLWISPLVDFKKAPSNSLISAKADIVNVEMLESKVITEVPEGGNFENRDLVVTFGISARVSVCEKAPSINLVSTQRSIESSLNPSDFYYRVVTNPIPGCFTAGMGGTKKLELTRTFSIDQRRISEKDKQWNKPTWSNNENIRHFSFDSGMLGGYNRWKLYRLDYTDIENVKFDFVKEYSYVQGQVINMK